MQNATDSRVARRLGDIRVYFPSAVVRVLHQDAIEINRAIAYGETCIDRPTATLVLISDLYEGGLATELVKRVAWPVASGVSCLCDTRAHWVVTPRLP